MRERERERQRDRDRAWKTEGQGKRGRGGREGGTEGEGRAQALSRPTILPFPEAAVSLLFGEMGEEMLLGGQRCRPPHTHTLRLDLQIRDSILFLRCSDICLTVQWL